VAHSAPTERFDTAKASIAAQLPPARRQSVDRGLVHVLKACPKSFVGFGVLKLQAALLIRRHHRNPDVNVAANSRTSLRSASLPALIVADQHGSE